jgi:hypothetical protein
MGFLQNAHVLAGLLIRKIEEAPFTDLRIGEIQPKFTASSLGRRPDLAMQCPLWVDSGR